VASFFALYLLTRIYVQSVDDLRKILPFVLGSGMIVVLYALYQSWAFLHGMPHYETMEGRPNATFAEADWLGIYLVLLLCGVYTLLSILTDSETSPTKVSSFESQVLNQNSKLRIHNLLLQLFFLYFPLILTYLALILTVSRSAWLGAMIVTGCYLLLTYYTQHNAFSRAFKSFSRFLLSLIIALGLIHLLGLTNFELGNRLLSTGTTLQKITISCITNDANVPQIITTTSVLTHYGCRHIYREEIPQEVALGNTVKIIQRNDPNFSIRHEIYVHALKLLRENWLFGIGWGSVGPLLGTDESGTQLNSSNIFLEVWLGSGIIGFVNFIAVIVYILLYAVQSIFASKESDKRFIQLFILLGAFALLVPNLFNAGILLGFFWLSLGIALSLQSHL
ncbi:MAG TPA: O-antigen ligase family protein, partial [Patescibacteria group bacterium]|nr:O-antigen ligase family protein [Patescibacteria group bacterium]